jgi:large subunit ribosomal protein L35
MPKKNKPNTSAQKRFKVTGSGKILRRQEGMRHLLSDKSRRRKRRLKKEVEVTGARYRKIQQMIG